MTFHVHGAKPFAWAGIALTIPAEWETGYLGDGYALLEYRFRPVLEIKTATIRGRFSFQRHFKELARSGQNKSTPPLTLTSPPPEWPAFSTRMDVQHFTWQGEHIGGRGLLIYCQDCHKATLIQFYDHGNHRLAATPAVLASFQDHTTGSGPTVAVYDIQATLPERFTLTRFQFDAGRFELIFGYSREIVTLWRWSPADVILERSGKNLSRVAQDNGLLPPTAIVKDGRPIDGGMEWQWQAKDYRSRLRRFFRQRAQQPGHALRIWHCPDTNRILAVRAETIDTFSTFDGICRSYGTL
jgi:hypothetical protein